MNTSDNASNSLEDKNVNTYKEEKKSIFSGLIFSGLLIICIWSIHFFGTLFNAELYKLGVYPLKTSTLPGIITMHFVHGNWKHLLSNTAPVFILSWIGIVTYKNRFLTASLFMLILTGFWTWLIGRPNYHIGASGMIYAWFSFLFFAGVVSKNIRLLAVSLLVVFYYGGLVWGVFPIQLEQSWEGHLSGFLSGIVMAVYYRKQLKPEKKYFLDEEDEDDNDSSSPENDNNSSNITYIYKKTSGRT